MWHYKYPALQEVLLRLPVEAWLSIVWSSNEAPCSEVGEDEAGTQVR